MIELASRADARHLYPAKGEKTGDHPLQSRELMKSARKAIAEFFGMERATKREILATVCYSKFTH